MVNGNISGFYYDEQLKNKSLTAALYPNTKLENGAWVAANPNAKNLEKSVGDSGQKVPDWAEAYSTTPIAKALSTEDFQIEISNQWTDFDGGNFLEGLFNTFKPYAPYVQSLAKGLKGASESLPKDLLKSNAVNAVNNAAGALGQAGEGISKYLNKALIVQGTRFAYYSGTNTRFGNLVMKYTIFPDWVQDPEKGLIFKSVNDQLNDIYPYVMGNYQPWDQVWKDSPLGDYFGWQSPPAGFEAGTKSIDTVLKGTMKLEICGYYSIENLLVRDIAVNMSRSMTKNPLEPSESIPLYADVIISLGPATLYTDRALMKFTQNKGMEATINEIAKANKVDLVKARKDNEVKTKK